MDHRDGVDGTPAGMQMPPEITHKVDTDGVAMIAAWLNGLSAVQRDGRRAVAPHRHDRREPPC